MTTVLLHQAIGGPVLVPGNLLVIVLGYLGPVVILVVFGIWGFRLGSRGSRGDSGGGGPKRPDPMTPPPGGREPDDERLLADLEAIGLSELPDPEAPGHERAHDLVAPRPGS